MSSPTEWQAGRTPSSVAGQPGTAWVEYDLSAADETKSGKQWKRFENDVMHYPYWIHGNAGIGSTVIRFAAATGNARYEGIAREIAESTFLKYTYNSGLFEWLTGIGEFMLDMYIYTNDPSYLDKAFDIAETLLWFRMERPSGAAYPGRWLKKFRQTTALAQRVSACFSIAY
jgi:hypothetical protein